MMTELLINSCRHTFNPKCYRCVLSRRIGEMATTIARLDQDYGIVAAQAQAAQTTADTLARSLAIAEEDIRQLQDDLKDAGAVQRQLVTGIQHRPGCQCSTCLLIAGLEAGQGAV